MLYKITYSIGYLVGYVTTVCKNSIVKLSFIDLLLLTSVAQILYLSILKN